MLTESIAAALAANAAAKKWEPLNPLPVPLSDFTATALGGSILVAGGCAENQRACDWFDADDGCTFCPALSARSYFYDVDADAWRRGLDMPRERYRHAAARDPFGNVYVVGGRDVNDNLVPAVDVFNGTTGRWGTLDGVQIKRSDLGALYRNGKLLVVGGYDADYEPYKESIEVDVPTGRVSIGPSLLEARGDLGLVETGRGRAYAVAGWGGAPWCEPLASVETLDLFSNWPEFAPAPPLKVARGDKAVVATEEHVYVIGGEHNNECETGSVPVDDVERLEVHPTASEWKVIADIPDERFRGAAAAVGGALYLFGGQATETTECGPGGDGTQPCFPVTDEVWTLCVEDCGGGGGGGKKSSKGSELSSRDKMIMIAVLAALGAVLILVCVCLCRRKYARGRQQANPAAWSEPPNGLELGKPSDPPPGHWRP